MSISVIYHLISFFLNLRDGSVNYPSSFVLLKKPFPYALFEWINKLLSSCVTMLPYKFSIYIVNSTLSLYIILLNLPQRPSLRHLFYIQMNVSGSSLLQKALYKLVHFQQGTKITTKFKEAIHMYSLVVPSILDDLKKMYWHC